MSKNNTARASRAMPRAEAIACLNDKLRQTGTGGVIVVTRNVQALPNFNAPRLLQELASYDSFDVDNDPHGERDLGDFELGGTDLLWKIDYYDLDMVYGSPDPADPNVTRRVLTVILPDDY